MKHSLDTCVYFLKLHLWILAAELCADNPRLCGGSTNFVHSKFHPVMLLKCAWLRGEETHKVQRFNIIYYLET